MLPATSFTKTAVRAGFLKSLEDFLKERPETIKLESLKVWERTCTNKTGFRQKRGTFNPNLPPDAKSEFGTVLCWPLWLTGDKNNRVAPATYKLPWNELDEYMARKAAEKAAPAPVVVTIEVPKTEEPKTEPKAKKERKTSDKKSEKKKSKKETATA